LKLPTSIDEEYLETLNKYPEGIIVSNYNIKGSNHISIYAYDKSDKKIGVVVYESESNWEGEILYSNGNTSITGTFT
jgi:hypothetical protein